MSKISDIAIVVGSGITPSKNNPNFWNREDIPWLRTEQLGSYKIYDTKEYISQVALKETNITIYPKNTVSVAMYGEGKTRGKVSILAVPMTTNQACCNIVIDETKANYLYVYYWLLNSYSKLRNLASGVRKNLNSYDIKNFEIDIKSLHKQDMIASLLSVLDDKIDNNKQINAELEEMAKCIYDYWFLQFDFPDKNGKPYKSSGGKMVWNEVLQKEIPIGWEIGRIDHFIKNDKGGDWGKDSEQGNYIKKVTCLRGTDFSAVSGWEELEAPERYILEKNSYKLLADGDLIIEISGGSPTQSTGRICYINKNVLKRFDNDIITSNFCKAIELNNKEFMYWFYIFWSNLYENNVFFKYEGKTTGIKNLLFGMLCTDYKIIIPDEIVIKNFNAKVQGLFETIQNNQLENQELIKLRDFLLPLLMNGQVTFKEE